MHCWISRQIWYVSHDMAAVNCKLRPMYCEMFTFLKLSLFSERTTT